MVQVRNMPKWPYYTNYFNLTWIEIHNVLQSYQHNFIHEKFRPIYAWAIECLLTYKSVMIYIITHTPIGNISSNFDSFSYKSSSASKYLRKDITNRIILFAGAARCFRFFFGQRFVKIAIITVRLW